VTVLAVESIGKSYGERQALQGVSLAVTAGETLALLGPNGAGKSTLFSILAGLRDADSGLIRFKGKAISADDPALRRALGVVFQSPSLDDLLSAEENLVLGAGLFGMSSADAKPRAKTLLEWVSLSDRASDRVGTFSGGMKRRLELARALMHQPEILLLDEPTSGLDENGYRQVWDHLEGLRRKEGLTIIVVTHRGDEAERCDRAMVLDEGRVIAEGTPEALRAQLEGDLLELEGDGLSAYLDVVQEISGVVPEATETGLRLRLAQAHQVVPRLIDRLPDGSVRAVHLRQPTLADVFVALTGRDLDGA
jgi:ABC-2 type transport system ATP-binding protein